MAKPANCGQEIYDMMLQCWKNAPGDRPTFTALHRKLEEILDSPEQRNYLELVDDL